MGKPSRIIMLMDCTDTGWVDGAARSLEEKSPDLAKALQTVAAGNSSHERIAELFEWSHTYTRKVISSLEASGYLKLGWFDDETRNAAYEFLLKQGFVRETDRGYKRTDKGQDALGSSLDVHFEPTLEGFTRYRALQEALPYSEIE